MKDRFLLSIFIISVSAWFVAFAIFYFLGGYSEISSLGTLGDYFGGMLNPVFSFMALIALLYTIRIQSAELKLSRNELELTRRELAVSSDSLKRQADHFEKESIRQDLYRIIDKLVCRINNNFNEDRLGVFQKTGTKMSLHYILKKGMSKKNNEEMVWLFRQYESGNVDVVKAISWINDDLERLILYIKEYESVYSVGKSKMPLRRFYQDEFRELVTFLRYFGTIKDYVFDFYTKSADI